MPRPVRINFVMDPRATSWPDLAMLDESAIERRPARFVGGRNSWIAQTYLRLREAIEARGWIATTGDRFLPGTISIVHRDDANRFGSPAHESFLVVVRADRAPVHACDLAVAQNGVDLLEHERFVPLWPQPGLVPRDARRGETVRCLAYQGRRTHAPRWFDDPEFHRQLERRRVRFEVREHGWEHYEGIDLAIAARDAPPAVLATKPGTKVYNAWLARVPVLVAPEPAYRELRRGPLDYIEVGGPADVLQALDTLRANPGLYHAMVTNGALRGHEFAVDATRRRWLQLLEREIVPRFLESRSNLQRRGTWYFGLLAHQRVASRIHKWRCALAPREPAYAFSESPPPAPRVSSTPSTTIFQAAPTR
jgi:hypothetical protein